MRNASRVKLFVLGCIRKDQRSFAATLVLRFASSKQHNEGYANARRLRAAAKYCVC